MNKPRVFGRRSRCKFLSMHVNTYHKHLAYILALRYAELYLIILGMKYYISLVALDDKRSISSSVHE